MKVVFESFKTFTDCSGAPSIVKCGAFVFAMDYLGSSRINLISGPSGFVPTRTKLDVIAAVKHAYDQKIESLGTKWIIENKKIYS